MKTVSFRDFSVGRAPGKPILTLTESGDRAARFLPGLQLLVAPNGYGKSTLLQTIAGQLRPLSGEARFGDTRLEAERDLTYVSEYLTFPKFIYPSEWVEFLSGRVWKGDLDRELEPWIARFRLKEPFTRFLGRLSQGERRKITWLGAHAARRPVVLLDEPLDGLDLHGIQAARAIVAEWKKEGRIVAIIAHQVSELLDLADQIFLIRDGGLIAETRRATSSDEFRARVAEFYTS